ncbi:lactonase family protein [Sphaerochaeta sp.]|uniref:lactonase family protein n=1 Tax=Sphaerochaeta sp. TaxID=1972642 RepID=UPI002FCBB0D9
MRKLVIGSRVSKEQEGIRVYEFDEASGRLTYLTGINGIEMPTFQCVDQKQHILYSVSETEQDGHIYAYQLSEDAPPRFLFTLPSLGGSPCHLSLDPSKERLAVANYANGVFTQLGLGRSFGLHYSESFSGTGENPVRQQGSHIHSSLWMKDGSSLFVADLGLDTIVWYDKSLQTRQLIKTPPATGPRHMVLSPDEQLLYIVAELSSETLIYRLGTNPTLVQRISTVSDSFSGENTAADLHFSNDYRFLYCSNRGHDSIVVYAVEPQTGVLTVAGFIPTLQEPRNFAISPSSSFLLVANGSSDRVTVHALDQRTGLAGAAIQTLEVEQPVCLTFVE